MLRAIPRFPLSGRAERGITLIELMVVVVILAILAGMGVPSMVSVIRDIRVSNATNEFVSAVNLARSEAIRRGRLVTMCRSVNAESGTTACHTTSSGGYLSDEWGVGWLVYVESHSANTAATGSSPATSVGAYNAGEEVLLRRGALPSGVNAINASAKRITFNGTGEPTGTAVFSINFNYDGQHARQFCMARTGRIRVIRDETECT